MACVADSELAALMDGEIAAAERDALLSHAGDCDPCRVLLSALALTLDPSAIRSDDDSGFGRYGLIEVIGRGAMGTVFRAHDPELDRDVAIKILRGHAALGGEMTERLRREARAMARVSHPNVVQIHDVGELDGEVFLAMELVEGETLRDWLARESRTRNEIVGIFLAAARGLSAIHEAGLVHRDIKPDNILIGKDGRVRVSDFGLVRGAEVVANSGEEVLSSPLSTRTGTVVGTPAYMAPEQLAGGVVDARSDQFALCATLFEALTGERAFDGQTRSQRLDSVRKGPPALPRSVPRRLARAIRRGLAVDPDARLDSLAELEAALTPRPLGRIAMVSAAALLMLALVAWRLWPAETTAFERFEFSTDEVAATVVSDIDELEHELALRPGAGEFAQAIRGIVAERLQDWRELRLSAWLATHVKHEQSAELFDRTMLCLDERISEMRAAIGSAIESEGARGLTRALGALRELPSIGVCSDSSTLLAPEWVALGAGERERYQELMKDLAAADVRRKAGVLTVAEVTELDRRATEIDRSLPRARIRGLRAALAKRDGRFDDAEADLREGIQEAARSRDHDMVARYWVGLMSLVANDQNRIEDARKLELVARAAVAQAGSPPRLVSSLHLALATLAYDEGRYDDAYQVAMEARRIVAAQEDADPTALADLDRSIGLVLMEQGRLEESERVLRAALDVVQKRHGDLHPVSINLRNNLALTLEQSERYEEAELVHKKVIELSRRLYGPDTLREASATRGLSVTARRTGRHKEALQHAKRALEIHDKVLGPEDLSTVAARATYANALFGADRFAESEVEWRGVVEKAIEVLGAKHPQVLSFRVNHGHTLFSSERPEEALQIFRATAADFRSIDARQFEVELAQVECLIALGRTEEARATMKRIRRDIDDKHPALEWAARLDEQL